MSTIRDGAGAEAVAPLVVATGAFPARGGGVHVEPRITVDAASRAPFPVRLVLPDGTERAATAALDLAHVRGQGGTFALVRLAGLSPTDVPAGTKIWRE